MTSPELAGESDPRLANPDQYFSDKYGDVVISHRGHNLPLSTALQFENLARTPEEIASDPAARRANVFIDMLRDTGVLDPLDDITYPEEP